MDKKSAIVIISAMTFGFLADVVQYSMSKSKGGAFRLHFPTGRGLATVMAVVLVEAIAIDFAMDKLDKALASKEENELKKLAEAELKKIHDGEIANKQPVKIVWMPKLMSNA